MKQFFLVWLVLSQLSSTSFVKAHSLHPDFWGRWVQEQGQQRKSRPRRTEIAPESHPPPQAQQPPSPETPSPARPFIRVALAVDVPSATISCDQEMVRIDEASQQTVRLAETEVRVEPAPSSEDPLEIYRVQVAAMPSRKQADGMMQRLRAEFQQEVTVKADAGQTQQLVYVGRFRSEEEAARFALKLRRAGYAEAKLVDDLAPPKPVLVARSPADEMVLRAPSQLTFAPLDEAQALLKFGGRAYRGQLVVQLNPRERLTVINELPLEEYLWSVVPNELGPTPFGELEALKAQAIAARTFAVRQKLAATNDDGYDVLADTRSQVYTGIDAEHPLSTRAVNETRGIIVTYNGEPIEAVYSSTCGGRTEDSESVFAEARPYLRSVLCAPEANWLASHAILSQRRVLLERPVALLQVLGLNLPASVTTDFLRSPGTPDEIYAWITTVAALMNRSELVPAVQKSQLAQLNGFARALVALFYPEDYVAALFAPADVDYILDYTDGAALPPESRAAIAVLVTDGILTPSAEGQLNPQTGISRADVLTALFRLLERAGSVGLKRGAARFVYQKQLVIEPEKEQAQRYQLSDAPFLFKLIGQDRVPVKRAIIIGGEKVWFHTDGTGRIDYLELQPNANGVARDRYSPVSRWEIRLKPAEVAERLRSRDIDIGSVLDLRILQRGASQRITALEIVSTKGKKELRGLAIRSALGLRENLFVIDRKYDEAAHVAEFIFTGRGWGHGVGLCQVGAYGLALEGFSFADILKAYYTGVEITTIY
ncbi:MAG: SpoIID/LytB domain-containing protein [Acidobacteria bacterium]|nr:SpoIID/LytB domain-containing protein [Acidobacteriota bacterium]